jgi:hypothetical protein
MNRSESFSTAVQAETNSPATGAYTFYYGNLSPDNEKKNLLL